MNDDNIKKRPSDSSEVTDEAEESEQKNSSSDDAYFKDIEELEKARKEREDRKKEELERLRKERSIKGKEDDEKGTEGKESSKDGAIKIGGQSVSRVKKEFSTEKKLFRHNKMFGFSGSGAVKIDRALKKAHINTDKRRDLIDALAAYNPSKTLLKKRDFVLFARKFKSKNFSGSRFKQASKTLDIKGMRKEFSKRDLNKFRMAVTGESDAHRYQTKTEFTKAGKPDRNAPTTKK
ncbi:MAG: hypothetical protein WC788_03620 [Candidatus Paceibacterota bacterium]|jgi:hypothetical protein